MVEGSQIVKSFQLTQDGISKKSDKSYGLALAKFIEGTVYGGVGTYYYSRNNRFRQNRNAANGRIDMTKFQDFLELNGKTNYVNINWQSIRIVNRIISGLVGRWMGKNEKVSVKATDPLSVKDKVKEYENIEFIMQNRKELEALQQASGVQMIPEGVQIPADKEELNLWVTQFQRLPEEIKYETGCNDVLAACGWNDVLKARLLHDSAEAGFVGTFTYMDEQGVVHVEIVKPENAFYSYSEFSDFRDTTWRGQIKAMKISELRKKYGVEFGGDLTEEKLWEIANTSKDFQLSDKITWQLNYINSYARPYDEFNVDVIDFEFKSVDSEPYTVTTTKKNKSTIVKKGKPSKQDENTSVVEDTKWNIYRGVKIKTTDVMLEWGLKTNMIRPQDPKEIGNAEFSYSFYMYQNYEMRNLAIPEKIEEPADQMILTRLKIQQLVAKMTPVGAAYDVDALQEINIGLASGPSTPTELQRIYQQTGNLYYRGRDAEGNKIPVPVTELANSGFLNQMQGLIALYQFHYQVLKDELGEDPNLITQALQPRVAATNVDTAQDAANNATGYMYEAYKWVMADTAKKISCLLKDSVVYGSSVYRGLLQQDDVSDRIFGTEIRMLPDEMEVQRFEMILNNAMVATPELIKFIDPFQLMRIAREDVKLGEVLFRQGQKKMLIYAEQQAQNQSKMNADAQIQSAQASEQEKRQSLQMELEMKGELEKTLSGERQKEILLSMFGNIYAKGLAIPENWKGVESEIINNVGIPLFAQNVGMVSSAMQAGQEQQENQNGMQEQPEQEQAEQGQEQQQPQEAMMA